MFSSLLTRSARPLLQLSRFSSPSLLTYSTRSSHKWPTDKDPLVIYTDGLEDVDSGGRQIVGIGVFVEDDHPLNVWRPVRPKKNAHRPSLLAQASAEEGSIVPLDALGSTRSPELMAVTLALIRVIYWKDYDDRPVIIRTPFEPLRREFDALLEGNDGWSRCLESVLKIGECFHDVSIEDVDERDSRYHQVVTMAAVALDEASRPQRKKKNHMRHANRWPLGPNAKK